MNKSVGLVLVLMILRTQRGLLKIHLRFLSGNQSIAVPRGQGFYLSPVNPSPPPPFPSPQKFVKF